MDNSELLEKFKMNVAVNQFKKEYINGYTRKEELKGSTTMLILNLLKDSNMYGYEMIKKLKEKSENVFELKEGTLYPILHGLEEKGFILSYWDESTAKKRKYYAITEKGKKQLKEKKEEWEEFSNGINRVLGGVSFAN